MKDRKTIMFMFLVSSTTLGAVGQFLFKYAFQDGWLAVTLVLGLAAYAISTAVYFYVLSRSQLSWTYAIGGISYIIAVILAATVLGEHVPILRWAGVLVIAGGVVLVGLS